MEIYAPLKDIIVWIKSILEKRKLQKKKKLNRFIFNENDLLLALLEKSRKDGTLKCGLKCSDILNEIPKEKSTNITLEIIKKAINKHLAQGNISSLSLDKDCNYILTKQGYQNAEYYEKSII